MVWGAINIGHLFGLYFFDHLNYLAMFENCHKALRWKAKSGSNKMGRQLILQLLYEKILTKLFLVVGLAVDLRPWQLNLTGRPEVVN